MKNALSIISGVLFIAAFVPYFLEILRGEAKPSKASWIVWAIVDSVTISGMYAEHTVNGQIVGAVVGAWCTVALTLKYGTSGWTRLDKFCLAGAFLGIALWQSFDEPLLAIITASTVVILGAFPTFVSAWKNPKNESRLAWTIFWLSCVCMVIAIPQWTPQDAIQPLSFTAIETTMMYLLWVRRAK